MFLVNSKKKKKNQHKISKNSVLRVSKNKSRISLSLSIAAFRKVKERISNPHFSIRSSRFFFVYIFSLSLSLSLSLSPFFFPSLFCLVPEKIEEKFVIWVILFLGWGFFCKKFSFSSLLITVFLETKRRV